MTPRHRNTILILVCAVLIVTLPMLQPDVVVPPFDWDWRTAPPVTAAPASPDSLSVRVLEAPDAAWTAELLHSLGLLGVAVGPPDRPGADETWVLTGAGCSQAEAALAHAAAGAPLVVLASCDGLLEALAVPAPKPWSQPAAVASAQAADGAPVRALALPDDGLEWPTATPLDPRAPAEFDPSNPLPPLLVRRMTGGNLVFRRDRVAVLAFDLPAHVQTLRQGDPTLAGIDTDGLGGTKANDLLPFPWASPTWRLPSADAWTEVLAAVIDRAAGERHPRLWPLPEGAPTVIVLTIEAGGASDEVLAEHIDSIEADDAEATFLFPAPPSGRLARRLATYGHGVGIQVDGGALGSPLEVERLVRSTFTRARAKTDPVRSSRQADGLWWGYDQPARLAAELGLDTVLDFVSVGPSFSGPGFGFGGSRPLRYRSSTGELLPVLQLPTPVWEPGLLGSAPWSQAIEASDRLYLGLHGHLNVATAWRVPVVVSAGASEFPVLTSGLLTQSVDRELPVMSVERFATFAWELRRVVAGSSPTGSVPLHRWVPGSDCDVPIDASPLSGTGCLVPVAVEPSPDR
ncbi:MAG: hypothetical protein GY898_20030 [Proteobacteria bacterium]|nr:hypothetical protein [Pseudomonadota bacterium]